MGRGAGGRISNDDTIAYALGGKEVVQIGYIAADLDHAAEQAGAGGRRTRL